MVSQVHLTVLDFWAGCSGLLLCVIHLFISWYYWDSPLREPALFWYTVFVLTWEKQPLWKAVIHHIKYVQYPMCVHNRNWACIKTSGKPCVCDSLLWRYYRRAFAFFKKKNKQIWDYLHSLPTRISHYHLHHHALKGFHGACSRWVEIRQPHQHTCWELV